MAHKREVYGQGVWAGRGVGGAARGMKLYPWEGQECRISGALCSCNSMWRRDQLAFKVRLHLYEGHGLLTHQHIGLYWLPWPLGEEEEQGGKSGSFPPHTASVWGTKLAPPLLRRMYARSMPVGKCLHTFEWLSFSEWNPQIWEYLGEMRVESLANRVNVAAHCHIIYLNDVNLG